MRRSLLLASLVALAATPVTAQVPLVPGALSLGGGVELPQGEGGTLFKQGLTAQAAYRIGIPLTPFAVRAEGSWSRFEGDAGVTIAGRSLSASGSSQILAGGLAAEMTVLPLIVFRGYVVGGASYTRTTGDFRIGGANAASREDTGIGYSAGVGAEFRLPFLPAAGLEVRYRYTPNALGGLAGLRSIPITARLTF
jgi:hypothetical protein